MCVNKMKIVEKILKANPKSFKKVDKLLSLGKNLYANENEEVLEKEVLNLIIDTAFQVCTLSTWYHVRSCLAI